MLQKPSRLVNLFACVTFACLLMVSLCGSSEHSSQVRCHHAPLNNTVIAEVSTRLAKLSTDLACHPSAFREFIFGVAGQVGMENILAASMISTASLTYPYQLLVHDVGAYAAVLCKHPLNLLGLVLEHVSSSLPPTCCSVSGIVHSVIWQWMQQYPSAEDMKAMLLHCASLMTSSLVSTFCHHPLGHGFLYGAYRANTTDQNVSPVIVFSLVEAFATPPNFTWAHVQIAEQKCDSKFAPYDARTACLDGLYDAFFKFRAQQAEPCERYFMQCNLSSSPTYCVLNILLWCVGKEYVTPSSSCKGLRSIARQGCVAAVSFVRAPANVLFPSSMQRWKLGSYYDNYRQSYLVPTDDKKRSSLSSWCHTFGELSQSQWNACIRAGLVALRSALVIPASEDSYVNRKKMCLFILGSSDEDFRECSNLMSEKLWAAETGTAVNVYRFLERT